MAVVFGDRAGEDEDVIQVDKEVDEVSEHVVHKGLKNSWSIGETKRHNKIFKMAEVSVKGCFPLVPFSYSYQMVGVAQVQLNEDGDPLEKLERGAAVCDSLMYLSMLSRSG